MWLASYLDAFSTYPILRLYSWENCITFGVGQSIDDYKQLQSDYKNNVSKRLTGGGVLFHGHDISYTILLNPNTIENRDVKETYFFICQFLLKFYEDLGSLLLIFLEWGCMNKTKCGKC